MSETHESPGGELLSLWGRLSRRPAGPWLFMRAVSRMVPYTGALGCRVESLAAGRATVSLRERRRVRNHLRSIHAVALVNLGEFATGLAVLTALEPGVRGIVTELSARYHAKARGRIEARCVVEGRWSAGEVAEAVAHLTDASGVEVATIRAVWKLGAAR